MPDIKWKDVTDHVSGLSAINLDAQNLILQYVNEAIVEDRFETASKAKLAKIYLAAHIGTMLNLGGSTAGPIASKSEGGVSVSYANIVSAGEDLDRTNFGTMYKMLVKNSLKNRIGIVM